ncbi:MAG TPA: GDP-L-fucose synthase [Planctomycetota bacterium]|nr:GDP-L-fucose synthase [Planctomycetota bacterium]
MSFWRDRRVLVTGAHGFFGSHIVDALRARGVPGPALVAPTSCEADLRDRAACERVVRGVDLVIHLAARTGGIGLHAEHPGEAFFDTALAGLLVMDAARRAGVPKFVGIGTTCSYPRAAPLPFREDSLWDGAPEPVTGAYGFAKSMLLVQGQAYRREYGFEAIHLIPVNLYGPRDRFDERASHVVAALVRRFVEAAEAGADSVTVWGTGAATRDFLYVEDAAEAVLLACERYGDAEPLNLGSGQETKIAELAALVAACAGFQGEIRWDASRPDGTPRRCVDVARAREHLGFEPRTPLRTGIQRTVDWYRGHR